jgi:hypothetical protein
MCAADIPVWPFKSNLLQSLNAIMWHIGHSLLHLFVSLPLHSTTGHKSRLLNCTFHWDLVQSQHLCIDEIRHYELSLTPEPAHLWTRSDDRAAARWTTSISISNRSLNIEVTTATRQRIEFCSGGHLERTDSLDRIEIQFVIRLYHHVNGFGLVRSKRKVVYPTFIVEDSFLT